MIYQAHEINPKREVDWTIPTEYDWPEEERLREARNELIKDQLQRGVSVQYRSSGNSLYPYVHSNDICMFEPVLHPETIKLGDIVFCSVQPNNRCFAHKVLEIYWHGDKRYFTIGNQVGFQNWYCEDHHIYGRLIEVVRP